MDRRRKMCGFDDTAVANLSTRFVHCHFQTMLDKLLEYLLGFSLKPLIAPAHPCVKTPGFLVAKPSLLVPLRPSPGLFAWLLAVVAPVAVGSTALRASALLALRLGSPSLAHAER